MEKENKWMKGAAAAAAIGAAIGAVKVVRDAKREADEKLFEDLVKNQQAVDRFSTAWARKWFEQTMQGKKGTCILPALQTRQPGCFRSGEQSRWIRRIIFCWRPGTGRRGNWKGCSLLILKSFRLRLKNCWKRAVA